MLLEKSSLLLTDEMFLFFLAQLEIVQSKVGDTAIFSWSYAQFLGGAILDRITLGTLAASKTKIDKILALKQRTGKPLINPSIQPEYKGRVAFTVDESSQTAQFSLKDVKTIDNGKYFGIEVETPKSMHTLGKMLEIVGEFLAVTYAFEVFLIF